jgi:selenocysteine lyase/cysteine desulfurase
MHDFAQHWQLDDSILYLNHAAVSPWPIPTQQAVVKFAQENATFGSKRYPFWLHTERELRQNLATLLNAPSADDIALVKNTSEGLSFIAYGLDWQTGDNVVISDQEFPSNRIVWESLQSKGVEVREVDLSSAATPEEALLAACDQQTRLLSISSVQFASGLRIELNVLGEACQQRDILFCVDAIQSLGAEEIDVQRCHADFVVADGHKWMMGPEGLGVMYVRDSVRDSLQLTQFGWHMVEHVGDFDRREWQPANSARRFECGSPNMLAIHALHASISLLLEIGMDKVAAAVRNNAEFLIEAVNQDSELELCSNADSGRYVGIVAFKFIGHDSEAVYQALMKKGVMCAVRHGAVRFSPHYYTSKDCMRRALEMLKDYQK